MNFVTVSTHENIATVTIDRPKVNALDEALVKELWEVFKELADNTEAGAVVLTGEGSFFSFGLDVPGFFDYSKDSFADFLVRFTDLLHYLFIYPKPLVAALNGHTIAGGCMLAVACDCRIMVSEKAKISLNEITFGSTVFASAAEILTFLVGGKNAETILLSGDMYSAEQARDLGLIHECVPRDDLYNAARRVAGRFAQKDGRVFRSIKSLLRKDIAENIKRREKDSLSEFLDIWYSEDTRSKLREIKIRD